MRASSWLFIIRALCLLCLGMSVALLLDYVSPEPAFCGVDSGCAEVRASGYGYIPLPFGSLPVPVLGVIAFTALFAASMNRSAEVQGRLVPPIAGVVAAGAVGFVVLQLVMQHFCWMCLTVDLSALLIAFCCFQLRGDGWKQASESSPVKTWFWFALLLVTFAAPLTFPRLVATSEIPAVIRELYRPGEVTVVEFFDFQCPHCRHLSPRLKKIVDADPQAELLFGYAPLPGHELARDAARVAICAAEQQAEKKVVERFFEESDLSQPHILEVAKSLVSDPAALDACLASTRPDERIEQDIRRIKEAGFVGLPTTYIGGTRLLGAEDDVNYRDALARAHAGTDRQGLSGTTFWLAVALIVAAIALLGRATPEAERSVAAG